MIYIMIVFKYYQKLFALKQTQNFIERFVQIYINLKHFTDVIK